LPLDPRVKRFLDALAAGKPPDARTVTVAQRRAQLAELMKLGAAAAPAAPSRDLSLAGPGGALAARLYSPTGAHDGLLPAILYLHGGGLVAGSIDTHAPIAQSLSHASGCRVLSLDYRLAPEHPFPAALEDVLATLAHVRAHASELGIDAARLAICGDSAGGTLSAAACHAQRRGASGVALQVLLCPILDYGARTGSRREFASGYLVDQATLDHDLMHYAHGGADPEDPRISPLRAQDLSAAPPTIVHTAEFDPLRDEGRDYFDRLTPLGSALSYTCHAGMIHLFYGLGGIIPYARGALERIGQEIRVALQ
jgi:acetyl esterase